MKKQIKTVNKPRMLDEYVAEAAKSCRTFNESVQRTRGHLVDSTKVVRRDLQEAFDILESFRSKLGVSFEADVNKLWSVISKGEKVMTESRKPIGEVRPSLSYKTAADPKDPWSLLQVTLDKLNEVYLSLEYVIKLKGKTTGPFANKLQDQIGKMHDQITAAREKYFNSKASNNL